jgi:hypothetical protein
MIFPLLFTAIIAGFSASYTVTAVSGMLFIFFLIAVGGYSLFIYMMIPFIAMKYSERESILDALRLGEVLRQFKKNWQEASWPL